MTMQTTTVQSQTVQSQTVQSQTVPSQTVQTVTMPSADFQRSVLPYLLELRGAAVRLAGSQSEADDLLQEAGMRAWQFRDHFEPGSNGRAWLHRILVNTFINGWRRKRREREVLAQVVVEPQTRASVAAIDGVALGDEVSAALAALPADFRAVLVLVDMQDRSYREVADALGCPIGTVMSRLHRARRAMQRRLSDYARGEGYTDANVADASAVGEREAA